MRIFVVAAVLSLAPVTMAIQNQPSSAQDRQKAQQANPATPISVNCNCAAQPDDTKNKPQGWHKLVIWPEGIATWALILTLAAIVWQAIESGNATRAMRESTDMQAIGFVQWVDLKNWRSDYPSPTAEGGFTIGICFDIVNATNLPMTLEIISIGVGSTRFDSNVRNFLSPDAKHAMTYPLRATQKMVDDYLDRTLLVPIRGEIAFTDVRNQWRTQPFGGLVLCSKDGTEFRSEAIMRPEGPMLPRARPHGRPHGNPN